MDPRDVHDELLSEIRDEFLFVAAGGPVQENADAFERLSAYFQALGICHLLETADVERFRENLVRSGYARRYFLRKSGEQTNTNDRHLALARSEAFLDSVAAGHFCLGREIADFSADRWEPAWEYEDDFCFLLFLHDLLRHPGGDGHAKLAQTLQRFDVALEGGDSLRLDVCKALLSARGNDFVAALHGLMEERKGILEDMKTRAIESEASIYLVWPRSFVSIEGLALLKFAELVGMSVNEEFPLCPRIGRLSTEDRDYPDMFKEIEMRQPGG